MSWMTTEQRSHAWAARMREFNQRRQDAMKCMRKHDEWLFASKRAPDDQSRIKLLAMAEAARECAAAIARCPLSHPFVSLDPAVRKKAWAEPDSA